MNRIKIAVFLFGLGLMACAIAAQSRRDEMAVMDSLRQMPRWEQVRWLAKRGLPDPYLRDYTPVGDSGIRCIGRWSYGPSTWVDVRATADDTIVFLSRGSGISIIRFRSQDSLRLDLLADINSHGLTGRCQVRDTLLYANSGGVECYDISNLTSPVLLNWLSQPLIYDFFVVDTFLYTSSRDSLRIFSVINPASPRWLGACADSGYVIYVSGSHAYLGHRAGLFILDVSNPATPHRVATMGFDVLSLWVKDTLLYFGTYDSYFRVYNVKNPTAPAPVGSLSGIAPACLYQPPTCDTAIYSSSFDVISVANPATPRRVGSVSPPGWEYGVSAVPGLNCALVADYFDGLAVIDIAAPQSPQIDSLVFNTGLAEDIAVDGTKLYVAGLWSGLHVLDISNPAAPRQLGNVDVPGVRPSSYAVVARDSFAYIGWTPVPQFRSVSVSDPTRPTLVGGYDVTNYPEDMVLRDTLVFAAEETWFQVVNVARPRQPVLVGSCTSTDGVLFGLAVQDTMAYEVSAFGLWIINVARPDSPRVVSSTQDRPTAAGLAVRDTLVFIPNSHESLWVYSVANPAAPYPLAALPLRSRGYDIVLVDTLAWVGEVSGIEVLSIAHPVVPRSVAFSPTPYPVRRLTYQAPNVFAAMSEAGVAVFDSVFAGLAEWPEGIEGRLNLGIRVHPSVVGAAAVVEVQSTEQVRLAVYDAAGRVMLGRIQPATSHGRFLLNLDGGPDGVYFLRCRTRTEEQTVKVVKQQ